MGKRVTVIGLGIEGVDVAGTRQRTAQSVTVIDDSYRTALTARHARA